nr:class I SAM-dependent methyltransferase [Phycisphaerae bacterium]NIR67012.1 class I SAM-dependent methyltransferase [candidate division Zixibacteria bacterium]NIT60906.1 class I SAM-dependent methyltransferase [Fodinibius sp.]NIW48951.1 hypothetical protein [Gammaproteobacteria bacterium]NIS48433.1 class I SAM-dependent methyltransferase [candidate division Zixibacteria bacterium]
MKYRGSVGPKDLYDIVGAQQFCVMVKMGMRDTHKMLDFGCGSLRGGRFFIPYLLPGNYHGVEPNKELLYAGIENELGWDAIQAKNVTFYHFDDWMMAEHLERNMFDYIL